MKYNTIIKTITKEVIKKLDIENVQLSADPYNKSFSIEEYTIYGDEEAVAHYIRNCVYDFSKKQGWRGPIKNRFGMTQDGLTLKACQIIAGNSPSIEESFNGQYRKDMFEDVALGAIYNDVSIELKKIHPETECYSFCERAR